jgi:hypothetical protein
MNGRFASLGARGLNKVGVVTGEPSCSIKWKLKSRAVVVAASRGMEASPGGPPDLFKVIREDCEDGGYGMS